MLFSAETGGGGGGNSVRGVELYGLAPAGLWGGDPGGDLARDVGGL